MPEIHAKLSASISKRWMLNIEKGLKGCPGSIILGSTFPQSEGNLAADTGTAAHYIGEWCLNNAIHPSEFTRHHPKPYIAVEGSDGIVKIDINDDLISGPTVYCETIWEDIERLEDDYLGEGDMFVEEQMCINKIFNDGDLEALAAFAQEHNIFQLNDWDIEQLQDEDSSEEEYILNLIKEMFNMFGTNDFSFLIPGEYLGVYDYKNGRWSVEVENNTQFLYYALGAAFEHDWNFEVCEMVVVQPNDGTNPEKVRRWVITKEELAEWIPIFRQAALDVIYKWKTFNPSQDSCHYCPASGGCEAQAQQRIDQCKMDFDDGVDDGLEVSPPSLSKVPALGSLTYVQIALIVNNADAIKSFVDGACKLSKSLLKDGNKEMRLASGKKLVKKRKNMTYSMTENETIAYLEEECMLERHEVTAPGKLLPIGKLKAIVEADIMSEITHRPDTDELVMVDEDDDREEVVCGAAADFEEFEDDEDL